MSSLARIIRRIDGKKMHRPRLLPGLLRLRVMKTRLISPGLLSRESALEQDPPCLFYVAVLGPACYAMYCGGRLVKEELDSLVEICPVVGQIQVTETRHDPFYPSRL